VCMLKKTNNLQSCITRYGWPHQSYCFKVHQIVNIKVVAWKFLKFLKLKFRLIFFILLSLVYMNVNVVKIWKCKQSQ